MKREKLRELAEDPRFIKGIYNYCDRWCERCPFTSRCLNFAMDNEQTADPEGHDVNNEAFWRNLNETLQMTLELLRERAEEEGFDPNSIDVEEVEEQQRLHEEVAMNHKCCRAARDYEGMVDDWFRSVNDLFGPEADEFNVKGRPRATAASPLREDTSTEEAVQVIRWYQHQIYVKLLRAILGSMEEKEEGPDEFARDSDGSAKVALIAMDRSIAAWGELRGFFPLRDNDILDILGHLGRLRGGVEKAFPDARAFIRPGFDKIDLNS